MTLPNQFRISKITYRHTVALGVRIGDYIELEELVDEIVAEHTQQEIDKEDGEGQVYLKPLPLV